MTHVRSRLILNVFLWMLSILAIMLEMDRAFAQVVDLPQIEIHGLEKYRGRYLTTYFALGHQASIALSSDQVFLREVRAKSTQSIGNQSVLLTPKMTVVVQGFTTPYNLVVLVIHSEPQFSWINANGSRPLGENADGAHHKGVIAVFSWLRQELTQFPSGQNGGSYRIQLP